MTIKDSCWIFIGHPVARGQKMEKKFFIEIVAKRAPEARKNGNVGKKKKKLKMSCREKKNKNKGKKKKPAGIKVSDIADYFFSDSADTG